MHVLIVLQQNIVTEESWMVVSTSYIVATRVEKLFGDQLGALY
jgi:hypothetical protein